MMTFERDFDDYEKFFDDFEKNRVRRRERKFEKIFDRLMYEMKKFVMQKQIDFVNKTRRIRRNKKFHEYIIIYNNVLSFCNEKIKMNEKHNA